MRIALAGALVVGLLQGCMVMRPEIATAPSKDELDAVKEKGMYFGPAENDLAKLIDFVDREAAWHKKRERDLRISAAAFDELQFYGALGGAIAGALNHLQAAKNSLGVAAGAGVLNSRYQMTAQAAIYKSASEAFICIRDVLDDAKAIQDKVQGLNVLEDYPEAAKQVRESTKTLLLKVESKMLAVQLPTPDFKGVKDALGGTKETPLARGQGLVSAAAAITTGAITSAEAKQLSEMKNDVKACEAGFN